MRIVRRLVFLSMVCACAWGYTPGYCQEVFTLYPNEDTWVNEANPAANYGNGTYLTVKDTSGASEALFKFSDGDLSKLKGKAIASASFNAYQYMGNYYPGDLVSVYKVSSPWAEGGSTWSLRPVYGQAAVSTLPFEKGVNVWRKWDGLGEMVTAWISAPDSNFGFVLSNSRDAKKDELSSRFYSSEFTDIGRRPYLEVTTQAAPEPVSGVLFLLGGGMVVLRRSRHI